MAECMETVNGCFTCRDAVPKRNVICVTVASLLFFLGWWVVIDTLTMSTTPLKITNYITAITATISFLMITTASNSASDTDGYSEGFLGQTAVKIWLFAGFFLAFMSVFAGLFLMAFKDISLVAIQSISIVAASMFYLFRIKE